MCSCSVNLPEEAKVLSWTSSVTIFLRIDILYDKTIYSIFATMIWRDGVIVLLLLLQVATCSMTAETLMTLMSPDGEVLFRIGRTEDSGLTYEVTTVSGEGIVGQSRIGLRTKRGAENPDEEESEEVGLWTDSVMTTEVSAVDTFMIRRIAERKVQVDQYASGRIRFRSGRVDFTLEVRLYNEGYGLRYELADTAGESIGMETDMTEVNLTDTEDGWLYTNANAEAVYLRQRMDGKSYPKTLRPALIETSRWWYLVNEAGNDGRADDMRLACRDKKIRFIQEQPEDEEMRSTWRYVLFSRTPLKLIDGKYVLWSLNEPPKSVPSGTMEPEWIKPGTVFRSLQDNQAFVTDTIKVQIDWCEKHNFKYLLLDAGWYGMGYSQEHNGRSDPFVPLETLDIEEVCRYGEEHGVGVIVYVNQSAWRNYDNEAMIRQYSEWGVKGIKMGFMNSTDADDLAAVYTNISRCMESGLMVNVHDEMRPSGVERTLPNLMTTEGVRGGEYRDKNDAWHTTTLPFTRFMTGPADYTIIYGHEDENTYKLQVTKSHMLALSVLYFSPFQHVLWYGRHWHWKKDSREIRFFDILPTVWDDYVLIEGRPGSHLTMARQSGDTWFLATATNAAREQSIALDFLEEGIDYSMTMYFDDKGRTFSVTDETTEHWRRTDNLEVHVDSGSGFVCVFRPMEGPVPTQLQAAGARIGSGRKELVDEKRRGVGKTYDLAGRQVGGEGGMRKKGVYIGCRRLMSAK